jgi:hypothetical protein
MQVSLFSFYVLFLKSKYSPTLWKVNKQTNKQKKEFKKVIYTPDFPEIKKTSAILAGRG